GDFRAPAGVPGLPGNRSHGGYRLQRDDEARLRAGLPARARADLRTALGKARRAAHRLADVALAPRFRPRRRPGAPCRALRLKAACVIIVFARAPIAGRAKTRLSGRLGPW